MLYKVFLFFCIFLPFQFALNPTSGIDLAITRPFILLMFVAALFLAVKPGQELLLKNKIFSLLLIFLVFASLSLAFSQNYVWSLRKLAFLFSIFPIYSVSSLLLDTKTKARAAITFLVTGGMLASVIGIFQFFAQFFFGVGAVYLFLAKTLSPFFLGNSFSETVLTFPSWLVNSNGTTYMRAVGIFPDPHMFSYYLGMLLPWSIVLYVTSDKNKKFFLFSSILFLTTDILTFTRGGYIALIVSLIVILPLVSKSAMKKIALATAALLLLFFIVPQNPVAGRFVSSFDVQEGSNQGRIENWKQSLAIISEHPLGVGIGMYSLSVNPEANYRDPIYAHNLYLDIAAELGLVSVIIFILTLIYCLKNYWVASKNDIFYIAGVSSITLFSVHSLVENPMYSVHVLPLFLVFLAISSLLEKYEKISDN